MPRKVTVSDVSDIINDLTSVGVNLVTNRVKERLRPTVSHQVEESALAHLEAVWKKEQELVTSSRIRGVQLKDKTPLMDAVEFYEAELEKEDEEGAVPGAAEEAKEVPKKVVDIPIRERLLAPLRGGTLDVSKEPSASSTFFFFQEILIREQNIKVMYQERPPVHPPKPKREFDPYNKKSKHKPEEPSAGFAQMSVLLFPEKGEDDEGGSPHEVYLSHMMYTLPFLEHVLI